MANFRTVIRRVGPANESLPHDGCTYLYVGGSRRAADQARDVASSSARVAGAVVFIDGLTYTPVAPPSYYVRITVQEF